MSHAISDDKQTFIYKTIKNVAIEVDIYAPFPISGKSQEPSDKSNPRSPSVLLFFHGGSWIAGNRLDYPQPLFWEFRQRGYHVASADYRLLPESPFVDGQLEDIRDLEHWLRHILPREIDFSDIVTNIIVAGSSAGALLALLTAKLWHKQPTAILSIYGPTDLHNISFLNKGLLAQLDVNEPHLDTSRDIFNFESPLTQTPVCKSQEEWLNPRNLLGIYMFRTGITTPFLLRGLCKFPLSDLGVPELRWPNPEEISQEEIESISPLHLASGIKYPPTYQILGADDDLFEPSHLENFAQALAQQNTPHAEALLPGKNHGFDIGAEVHGDLHLEVFRPAVDWLVRQSQY